MAERREYRSSVRSRRMLREAFLELLEEKEFGKITVTANHVPNFLTANRIRAEYFI